jgi:hypothetical protein
MPVPNLNIGRINRTVVENKPLFAIGNVLEKVSELINRNQQKKLDEQERLKQEGAAAEEKFFGLASRFMDTGANPGMMSLLGSRADALPEDSKIGAVGVMDFLGAQYRQGEEAAMMQRAEAASKRTRSALAGVQQRAGEPGATEQTLYEDFRTVAQSHDMTGLGDGEAEGYIARGTAQILDRAEKERVEGQTAEATAVQQRADNIDKALNEAENFAQANAKLNAEGIFLTEQEATYAQAVYAGAPPDPVEEAGLPSAAFLKMLTTEAAARVVNQTTDLTDLTVEDYRDDGPGMTPRARAVTALASANIKNRLMADIEPLTPEIIFREIQIAEMLIDAYAETQNIDILKPDPVAPPDTGEGAQVGAPTDAEIAAVEAKIASGADLTAEDKTFIEAWLLANPSE